MKFSAGDDKSCFSGVVETENLLGVFSCEDGGRASRECEHSQLI